MTEYGKRKLLWLSIFLLLVSVFFWLEERGAPGWKTGVAFLSMAVVATIDFYLEKSKAFRLSYAAFSLFFLGYALFYLFSLLYAIKNFLAN
ncbi:MAG: hypothetical protein HYW90_02715 [Candidatus Sungbacteria bacterium]|nr:hypothetical protein [Candidatus Sungbacteria bacterium]